MGWVLFNILEPAQVSRCTVQTVLGLFCANVDARILLHCLTPVDASPADPAEEHGQVGKQAEECSRFDGDNADVLG